MSVKLPTLHEVEELAFRLRLVLADKPEATTDLMTLFSWCIRCRAALSNPEHLKAQLEQLEGQVH